MGREPRSFAYLSSKVPRTTTVNDVFHISPQLDPRGPMVSVRVFKQCL